MSQVNLAEVQRRTVLTLVLAQAVGALGMTIGIATASLLAKDISGSETQAGLSQTFQVLGAAIAAFLLARLMAHRGRRVGLTTGLVIGAAGAGTAVLAGVVDSMALLLVGATMLGCTTAANNSARYAATDLATEQTRARSLSIVVWATTIGAVAGPNLTGLSARVAHLLGIPELTGPFALGGVGMLIAALIVGLLLRPDPLLLAREQAGLAASPPSGTSWGRVAQAVRDRPVLGAAIAGLAGAHAAMVSVMVMTPLHMEHGGSHLEVIGFVLSIHVLGMFALAPVMGWLADRFSRAVVIASGGLILIVSLVLCHISPAGNSWQITLGLFLLGLGWSAATVGSSTLIADHAPLSARTDIQGASDLLMGLTAAAGGGLAGVIMAAFGYPSLALVAVILAVLVIGAGAYAGRASLSGQHAEI